MRNTFLLYIFLLIKAYFSLYIVSYNEKYAFMYNKNICCNYMSSYIMTNKYCYYTSYRIMRNTLSCIIKIFVLIICLFM